jgi:hypothetical protein
MGVVISIEIFVKYPRSPTWNKGANVNVRWNF